MTEQNWTIWFTGLHGAGKSTIANKLVSIFRKHHIPVVLLDGDEIRKTISYRLGCSLEERDEHMRRVANICKLVSENGVLAVASVASPTEKSRKYAKTIIKKFFLVYVKCPLEICEKRDVKGHYKSARKKQKGFENFINISSKFEEPKKPNIILNTDKEPAEKSVNRLLSKLKENGIIKI